MNSGRSGKVIHPFKTVVLNLWVETPLKGCIPDIYLTIYNSSKILVMK